MSKSYFQFKQFTVWHDRCAMKVGTDGVLLGAWASTEKAYRILDIGTGTGLIALMLAQRSLPEAEIRAVEIDVDAAGQAKENVARSPWKNRIEVVLEDLGQMSCEIKYDLIVSNPPYFVNSLSSPNEQRNKARHNDLLPYDTLIEKASGMLSDNGVFAVVIPADESARFKNIASMKGLHASRQLSVITKPGGIAKRVLLSFSFDEKDCVEEELLIEVGRHQYSEAYIALTRDYYLNM